MGRREMQAGRLVEKPKERDHLQDLGIGVRIILKKAVLK
jgi:hypothetical protein